MLDAIRDVVRSIMHKVAQLLNRITKGRLSPDVITLISLIGHIIIFWLIIGEHTLRAGVLLVGFGLMDTLDGELARLQKRDGPRGMLLDASSDRMKEGLLYAAIVYRFASMYEPAWAMIAVLALAGSFVVSYTKAKAETAIASSSKKHTDTNKAFQYGLMRYEVRMTLLVVGLCYIPALPYVIAAIAVLSWGTACMRLARISKQLS